MELGTTETKFKLGLLVLLCTLVLCQAAPTNSAPPFAEVYSLLRSNLSGIDERTLDQAATRALLREFRSQVQLVSSNGAPAEAVEPATEGKVQKVEIYEDFYGYLRLTEIGGGLAEKVSAAISKLNA